MSNLHEGPKATNWGLDFSGIPKLMRKKTRSNESQQSELPTTSTQLLHTNNEHHSTRELIFNPMQSCLSKIWMLMLNCIISPLWMCIEQMWRCFVEQVWMKFIWPCMKPFIPQHIWPWLDKEFFHMLFSFIWNSLIFIVMSTGGLYGVSYVDPSCLTLPGQLFWIHLLWQTVTTAVGYGGVGSKTEAEAHKCVLVNVYLFILVHIALVFVSFNILQFTYKLARMKSCAPVSFAEKVHVTYTANEEYPVANFQVEFSAEGKTGRIFEAELLCETVAKSIRVTLKPNRKIWFNPGTIWTAEHVLDASSPLLRDERKVGLNAEWLTEVRKNAGRLNEVMKFEELIVCVKGTSEETTALVWAMKKYTGSEIMVTQDSRPETCGSDDNA